MAWIPPPHCTWHTPCSERPHQEYFFSFIALPAGDKTAKDGPLASDEDIAVEKISVFAKTDGSAIQIKTSTFAGDEIHLTIRASEARNLMQLLLASMEHLAPAEQFAPENDRLVPISSYEVGDVTPNTLFLALHTHPFGRLSFAMSPEEALRLAKALKSCGQRLRTTESR